MNRARFHPLSFNFLIFYFDLVFYFVALRSGISKSHVILFVTFGKIPKFYRSEFYLARSFVDRNLVFHCILYSLYTVVVVLLLVVQGHVLLLFIVVILATPEMQISGESTDKSTPQLDSLQTVHQFEENFTRADSNFTQLG